MGSRWPAMVRSRRALAVALLCLWSVEGAAFASSWGLRYWLVSGAASAVVIGLAVMSHRLLARCAVANSVALLALVGSWRLDLPALPGPSMAICLGILTGSAMRRLRASQAFGVAAVGGLLVLMTLVFTREGSDGVPLVTAMNAATWGTAVATGLYLWSRDGYVAVLRRSVARDVRLDLARDLHDVVAHHLTGIVLQAQGGRLACEDAPGVARDALLEIERAGSDAMRDIRRMVGVLREGEAGDTGPHLEELEGLVGRHRLKGVPVTLTVTGDLASLPAELRSTLHRLVQESLTNVSRHASRVHRVDVSLLVDEDDARLHVADDGEHLPYPTRAGNGFGLLGMRERVAAFGGEFRAGRRPKAGWEILATLPLRRRQP